MIKILVVEDDKHVRKLMNAVLKREGYEVLTAENGIQALEVLEVQHIDLIILDIMMPEMDGFEFAEELRNANNMIPILMATAKQLPEDKKKGFRLGTDDYMTKPVDTEEMLLRIQALLRRSQIASARKLVIGKVHLDYDTLTVTRDDDKQTLPQKEFYLLYKLLSYPERIFTRIQLMDEIWGMDSETTDTTVNVHINRLRKRFESYPEFELISDFKVLTLIILIACIIIGTVTSGLASRRMLKSIRTFIDATNQLAGGDFSTRLRLNNPPEFKILSANFNRMADELGGIEILRTDFVNNFSHEFRTPIVSIKGFAEILKDDELSKDERNEYLDIVIEESSRLATLASNVLNLSKVEAQTILTDRLPFNVGEQIRQCVLLLHPKLTKKDISLQANVQDYEVLGNKEMLSQVWLNLLDNAIKFTPEHGEIEISMRQDRINIEITFRDNGTGISAAALPRVFDKFYQQDTSHSSAGNGLGLTIVRKITQLHGGTIRCDSVPMQGTTFTLLLPASKKLPSTK
ncbi:hypothetical protein KC345_g10955 [Hortaea werneckii]|nr:hypothetical protein KC345_g10955 [Hortaea werneckii]